jgi:hypothetical protein
MKFIALLCLVCAAALVQAKDKLPKVKDKDMLRKMIVYDKASEKFLSKKYE